MAMHREQQAGQHDLERLIVAHALVELATDGHLNSTEKHGRGIANEVKVIDVS